MPISEDILTLEIEPPYIGSAVSPTVDIDETTDDITVTITDFRGEHSYTVEKTDQAIANAEQAAQNANDTAQTVAQGWANRQNEINVTMNSMRTLMTNSANAESQRVIAENARVNAENAREQEWNELSSNATAATDAANAAAGQATTAAQNADTATNAANDAVTRANNAITSITQSANQIFAQAGQATIDANAAATNANNTSQTVSQEWAATKAEANAKISACESAAGSAYANAQYAQQKAEQANTAAQQADAAREAIQDDLAVKADKDGYHPQLTAGLSDTLMSGDSEVVQFAQRVSERDGMVSIKSLRGNTVRWNQIRPATENESNLGASAITTNGITVASGTVSTGGVTGRKLFLAIVPVENNHKYFVTTGNVETGASNTVKIAIFDKYTPITNYSNTAVKAVFTVENGDIRIASENLTDGMVFDMTCKIQIFDLTTMFGASNEPATVEEFEALFPEDYYPYDAGSLLSVNVEGVEATGKNLIDCAYDNKSSSAYRYEPVQNDLVLKSGVTYTVKPFGKVAESNANIHKSGSNDPVFHWGYYKTQAITITPVEDIVISKASIAIAANTFGGFTLEVGTQATEYVPYKPSVTREIPASTYFPNGMRSAGTAYDELDFVNHKAVTRIGAVDLGTLIWQYDSQNARFFTVSLVPLIANGGSGWKTNLICESYITQNGVFNDKEISEYASTGYVYIKDEAYTDAATFKAAMNGVMLYYELATSTETDLPENLQATYPVELGGTESIVIPTGEQSAPPTMAIVYGYTADGVRDETQSIVAPVERGVASSNYGVGSYLVMGGILYRVTTAIATGETINPGTNCVATTVMAELVALTA